MFGKVSVTLINLKDFLSLHNTLNKYRNEQILEQQQKKNIQNPFDIFTFWSDPRQLG